MYIDLKNKKIVWEDNDFVGHPDMAAVNFETLPPWEQKALLNLPVVCHVHFRYGRGYILPDGLWLFPGKQEITWVISYDYPEEEKEGGDK